MKKTTGAYPRVQVDTTDNAAVGQAGGVVLVETIRSSGLDTALSAALRPWRKPLAVHDPAKTLLDLAVALAIGGDCLAPAPSRTRRLRCGGVGSDGVAAGRRPRRRCGPGLVGDRDRSSRCEDRVDGDTKDTVEGEALSSLGTQPPGTTGPL